MAATVLAQLGTETTMGGSAHGSATGREETAKTATRAGSASSWPPCRRPPSASCPAAGPAVGCLVSYRRVTCCPAACCLSACSSAICSSALGRCAIGHQHVCSRTANRSAACRLTAAKCCVVADRHTPLATRPPLQQQLSSWQGPPCGCQSISNPACSYLHVFVSTYKRIKTAKSACIFFLICQPMILGSSALQSCPLGVRIPATGRCTDGAGPTLRRLGCCGPPDSSGGAGSCRTPSCPSSPQVTV